MDSFSLGSITSDKYPGICFEVGSQYLLPNGHTYIVKRITSCPPIIYFNITTGPNASKIEHSFPLEMAAKIQHNQQK